MTAQKKIDCLLLEMLIRYRRNKYYGPLMAADARFINLPESLPSSGGYANPHDAYGRGNKWGKKSFNDYRGAL